MYYFAAAGRGETIRLIAAAGGVELLAGDPATQDVKEYGSPSGTPILQHGELKMSQSTAIESYMSLLAFPDLTPDQRAKDMQFCSIKEDVLAGIAKYVFTPELKEKGPEELPKHFSKWFPVIEKLVPADGFINGLAYPTAADLTILNMCKAFLPFAVGYKIAALDLAASYPKIMALSDRVAKVPNVAAYLAKSETMTANPFGL